MAKAGPFYRKEALNRLAPGYNPSSFLVPNAPLSSATTKPLENGRTENASPPPLATRSAEEEFASLKI